MFFSALFSFVSSFGSSVFQRLFSPAASARPPGLDPGFDPDFNPVLEGLEGTAAPARERPLLWRVLVWLALIVAGTGLLAFSAKLKIPLGPVPFTFQTPVILGLGFFLGPRLGGAVVLAYLLEGALGLPVFAGTPERGLGLAYMMGPTGGYLLGFLLSVLVVGFLSDNTRRATKRPLWRVGVVCGLGLIALYVPGLVWLGFYLGWSPLVLSVGLYPFILPDLLSVGLLGLAVHALAAGRSGSHAR